MASTSEEFKHSCEPDDNDSVILSDSPSDSEKKQLPEKKNEIASEMKPFIMLKRRQNVLSLETKVEIIHRLQNGESPDALAAHYNIGRAIIFDIENEKDQILNFTSELESDANLKTRKAMRRRKANRRPIFYREGKESESNPVSQGDEVFAKHSNNGSSSTSKRKYNVLPIESKLEIIKRLENGESMASLASAYDVSHTTVFGIKRRKEDLLKFSLDFNNEDGLKNRKTMRKANDKPLEEAIYGWCMQNWKQGKGITRPLICEKALELNTKFGGPPDFKASLGWWHKFKSRHGIKQSVPEKENVTVEKPSANNAALDAYFNLLQQDGYSREDIYITEKFKINLKSMPTGLSIYQQHPSCINYPTYVTIMMCANSNWTHVLPLLMIGKSKKEKYFKNAHCLPLLYKSEKKAHLDSHIFIEWYKNEFMPAVTKERCLNGISGKVLLCLSNELFFPILDTLNVINDDFQVTFLSPVENTVVHSIYQAIISKFKTMFKIQIFNKLLLLSDSVKSMVEHAKKITVKEFSYMLGDAWNSVTEEKLKEEWIKLRDLSQQTDKSEPLPSEKKLKETIDFIKLIPDLSKCDREEIRAWLCDDDCEHQVDIKQEIILPVLDDECTEDDEGCKMDCMDYFNNAPSNFDALTAFETITEWCEQQNECSPDHLLFLKRLKNLASNKYLNDGEIKIKL